MIVEFSCPTFKYKNESIYLPIEIAYVIFNENRIYEIFSTRIKYDLTKYPKLYWYTMFNSYIYKFASTFQTMFFYELYNLYELDINKEYENKIKDKESFYKSNYGLDSQTIKNILIKKIKKYNIKIYIKNTIRLKHFLEDHDINIYDLKDLGLPKYTNISNSNRINYITEFYNKYKKASLLSFIKINHNIFSKEVLFLENTITKLIESDIPIYKLIVLYTLFNKFIHQE